MEFKRGDFVSVTHGGHSSLYRFYRIDPEENYVEVTDLKMTGVFSTVLVSDLQKPTDKELTDEALMIQVKICTLESIYQELMRRPA